MNRSTETKLLKVTEDLLFIAIVWCFVSFGWASTYKFDLASMEENHCCVEMTNEVSAVFTILHIPHKIVCGMEEYNSKENMTFSHIWIMVETPAGEIPFECTSLIPLPFSSRYYDYTVLKKIR